ncbi:MAG TPA: PhoU domain-containing protein [Acidimicrobiales bacterium]|jgi:phosphate transport system protein|nr:PhoU domain-containing protein [Acidimicrobiales bacterium]
MDLIGWQQLPASVEQLDAAVLEIFGLVRTALNDATDIFLHADRDAARRLVERDEVIDALHHQTETATEARLLCDKDADLPTRRHLLLILAILPELERSGDLAEHIASHAVQGLAEWLSPRGRKLVAQMGELGTEMWAMATDAFRQRDGSVADALRSHDDEIDDLHVSLTSELAASHVSVPVAIEMALVARYFERLGDHAVNVTRRLQAISDQG